MRLTRKSLQQDIGVSIRKRPQDVGFAPGSGWTSRGFRSGDWTRRVGAVGCKSREFRKVWNFDETGVCDESLTLTGGVGFSAVRAMLHRLFVVLAALSIAVARLGAEDDRYAGSAQIVVVAAAAWESTTATLTRFERTARGWSAIDSWPVTLGQSRTRLGARSPSRGAGRSRETRRRPPRPGRGLRAGVGLRTKAFEPRGFPWRRTDGGDLWVDDPESSHYNQWCGPARRRCAAIGNRRRCCAGGRSL